MHEDTMLTERYRSPEVRRFEKLIVLRIASMGLSFVARTCNVHGLSQVDQSVLGCFAMRLGLN